MIFKYFLSGNEKYFLLFKYFFQACAPRYIYYIFMDRRDPVGVCHIAKKNFREFRRFRPCVESGNFASKSLMRCLGRPVPRDTSGFQEI